MKFGGFDIGTDDSLISTYEVSGFTIVKIGWPAIIWLAALVVVIVAGAVF